METSIRTPSLVASTTDVYCCSIAESRFREAKAVPIEQPQTSPIYSGSVPDEVNYFKSAQWTPDGTSLITSSADNTIRTFILPPTLLEGSSAPITLTPYTKHTYPSSINCLTCYPLFDLSDPTTTLYLSTPGDLPIRLVNSLSPSAPPVSTYKFINPTTEAYCTPASILWSAPGSFLAGADCLIGGFDVSRNGDGPVVRLPTIPSKRHKMKGGGVGMRGIVSALSMQPSSAETPAESGMLAAGTWTRWIGLYDTAGLGGTVATWSIAEAADLHAGIGGDGVTQTLWSECGRYLYVVERKSNGVLVFDVRVTGKLVAWVEGRKANTMQRMSVDVLASDRGMDVWAGGTDGIVRVWKRVGLEEGGIESSWEWKGHDDPVSSAIVHSTGTVVATCSGKRAGYWKSDDLNEDTYSDASRSDGEDSGSDKGNSSPGSSLRSLTQNPDNSIKVWSI